MRSCDLPIVSGRQLIVMPTPQGGGLVSRRLLLAMQYLATVGVFRKAFPPLPLRRIADKCRVGEATVSGVTSRCERRRRLGFQPDRTLVGTNGSLGSIPTLLPPACCHRAESLTNEPSRPRGHFQQGKLGDFSRGGEVKISPRGAETQRRWGGRGWRHSRAGLMIDFNRPEGKSNVALPPHPRPFSRRRREPCHA